MKTYFVQDLLRGGGTERQSIELTAHIKGSGLEAKLLVGSKGGALEGLGRDALGSEIQFISEKESWLSHLKAFLYLWRITRKEPAIFICMGLWAHLIFGLLPRHRDIRLISTVRSNRGLPYLYRRCIQKSHLLIANSHWAAEDAARRLSSHQFPASAVVHNPLSRPELLEINPSEKSDCRHQRGIDEDQFVLLNVARLVPGKGQADLIHALAKLKNPNLQLWLLGDGSEKEPLMRLASDLEVGQSVFFPGFKENLRPYYAMADLFVSASTLDSLPNALIEAHAAGLPIVAYPSAGIPEIVDHETTGILCQENTPSEIARWIAHASEQSEWRQLLGSNGREKIRTEFSREQLHRDFRELVMNPPPAPGPSNRDRT